VLEKNRSEAWIKLFERLSYLQAVPGRMQPIELPENSPTVLVDFAHTPDALQQVLIAIKQHLSELTAGRLWVVFGCGGDRDQGKRPLMAKVVEHFADKAIVTSDNPRSESPEQIAAQVMAGFKQPNRVHVVLDRAKAIEWVLSKANSEDVVLIAGKGHENYQEINGTKMPFQDEAVVLNWALGVKK
jgi:UDP-N-acetylmuramyl-tripeptide synthetase